ncbi:hypothetical protein HOB94_02095 [bacterium]|nr:hypothetical protein [bacterium]MBT4632781.1 hypothetical protein [bacterium]
MIISIFSSKNTSHDLISLKNHLLNQDCTTCKLIPNLLANSKFCNAI